MRAGQAETRSAVADYYSATRLYREAGVFVYEWGDDYYHTGAVISDASGSIDPAWVQQESWIPEGSTLEGFGHAHPPPSTGQQLGPGAFNYPNGMHVGDVSAFEANYFTYKQGSGAWLESTVTPEGYIEFWRPGTGNGRITVGARLQ